MTLVREFHLRYGLPAPPVPPLVPDPGLIRLRARLIREEFQEVLAELGSLAHTTDPAGINLRLRALLKELADLRYVIDGTAVALGLDIDEAFEIVHASNMTKTGDTSPDGKILKGTGYVAPDMAGLVPSIVDERKNTPYRLEHSNEVVVNVHDESLCAGQPCTIHNRSDHNMRSFPQHWRADRRIMERICPHDIGHPDPDEVPGDTVHGCDGCCAL